MPFNKFQPVSSAALAFFAGIKLSVVINTTVAQPSQFNCLPNKAGDGWICENIGPIQPTDTTRDSDRYNSETAILPPEPSAPQTTINRQNNLIDSYKPPVDADKTSFFLSIPPVDRGGAKCLTSRTRCWRTRFSLVEPRNYEHVMKMGQALSNIVKFVFLQVNRFYELIY